MTSTVLYEGNLRTVCTHEKSGSVEKIMKADPRRIGGINLTFHFPDTLQVDEKQKTILERAANTCPVMYSIHPDIEVKVAFNWKPEMIIG